MTRVRLLPYAPYNTWFIVMIRTAVIIAILSASLPAIAESGVNIKAKNIAIGSYFVLFDESLSSNEMVGLIGQSYFRKKGIFIINNGYRNDTKVFDIIVKDKVSGNVEMVKKIAINKKSSSCESIRLYDWLIECNVYKK